MISVASRVRVTGGQAKFGAASLVAKLEWDVLFAKRGVLERRKRASEESRLS